MTNAPRIGIGFVLAGVTVFAAECLIVAALFADYRPGVLVAAHGAIVALLAVWTLYTPANRADLRLPLLLTAMTAGAGPVGAAGTLLTAVLTRRYARTAAPFDEWYASLFPDTAAVAGAVRGVAAASDRGSVAPFADILAFGDLAQKQELIALIANEFRPAFAPALRMALDDRNNAVRVQAASAITRVEHEFLQRSLALAEQVRAHPDDAALLREFATLHDEYASAGILDADRTRESRQQAREAYLAYLKLTPGDDVARSAVGRLLLRDGRYEEAAAWLVETIAAPQGRVHALLLWMEAQFHLGRFAEVRWAAAMHAAELIQRDDTPLLARETLKLWAGRT